MRYDQEEAEERKRVETDTPIGALSIGRINCRCRGRDRNPVREEISRIIAGRNAVRAVFISGSNCSQ